jgi:probable addiction module antidote protein
MKPYVSFQKLLMKDLKDPNEAAAYLSAALEEGDKEFFLVALKDVLTAQGGMTKISRLAKLHRVSLYKMLSKNGNPGIDSLIALLNAIGFQLVIAAKKPKLRKAA